MASKNSIKLDIENAYYHVYNRGVEKRNIFEDTIDYKVFLNYLKEYLSPPPNKINLITKISFKDRVFKGIPRLPKNYYGQIELVAYCLMPNHFHFLIRQNTKSFMKQFIHSLLLRYSTYFNKKYKRVGPLFQGRYKAVLINDESYLLHLSRYIHINPSKFTENLIKAYSSYADYIGLRNTPWINPDIIISFFNKKVSTELKKINTYKKFVEIYKKDSVKIIENLTLESEESDDNF